jgi:hypothetical protein
MTLGTIKDQGPSDLFWKQKNLEHSRETPNRERVLLTNQARSEVAPGEREQQNLLGDMYNFQPKDMADQSFRKINPYLTY